MGWLVGWLIGSFGALLGLWWGADLARAESLAKSAQSALSAQIMAVISSFDLLHWVLAILYRLFPRVLAMVHGGSSATYEYDHDHRYARPCDGVACVKFHCRFRASSTVGDSDVGSSP